jgi:hypothetical protein
MTFNVKVLIHEVSLERLAFDIILEDYSLKTYNLDSYAIKAYRGAGVRSIVQDCVEQLAYSLEIPYEKITLTFL